MGEAFHSYRHFLQWNTVLETGADRSSKQKAESMSLGTCNTIMHCLLKLPGVFQ